MKKICRALLLLLPVIVLTACAASQPTTSGDYQLRAATPGVVDHNVIPKKQK